MIESILNKVLKQIEEQGTLEDGFYKLNIPSFTVTGGKLIKCVGTPSRQPQRDCLLITQGSPIVVFYQNPGEGKIREGYEKDFKVTEFNKIITLTLNTFKNSRLKLSAEEKLPSKLAKHGVKDWYDNGYGIYYGISEDGYAVCARYDKEDSADSTSGIRVEMFPSYEILRKDEAFIKYMKNDAMEGNDWNRLGKFIAWCEKGIEEYRPTPMDLYYSGVSEEISGVVVLYLEDEYETVEEKAEKSKLTLADTRPYSGMVTSIKTSVLELIEIAVMEHGAQVDPKMEIAYADTECGLKCNHSDNTIGVAIQPNQDNKERLELSFIHGTSFESIECSVDVPLDRFPVESLIKIYNNLK